MSVSAMQRTIADPMIPMMTPKIGESIPVTIAEAV